MPISTGSGPEGSTARPRERMRSSIVPPLLSSHSVGPGIGKGEALENLAALDAVHDELQAVAVPVVERSIEPDRRKERVLRALHEGHPVRPVAETQDSLDPQQVIAAVRSEERRVGKE